MSNDIRIVVRFNGQQLPAILSVGEPQTLDFGSFPVEIEAVQIIRKPRRPSGKPPYTYIFLTEDGVRTKVRAKDKANARRIFRQRNNTVIQEILTEFD